MYYSAIINGVKSSLQDPNIDSFNFRDEEEAIDFIIDEYDGKHGIELKRCDIEIFTNASQRGAYLGEDRPLTYEEWKEISNPFNK